MMTIEHLSFGYSKRKNRVLNDCSLRIDEGKIYGLLGKNGVGKSTLLYLMTGLLTPTEGHACLNGTDVRLRRPDTLSDFFLIPEEFDLPDYNLKKYVRLNAPFYPHFDHDNLLRNLEMFELPEDIKLGELSMGQKKKALICFALATRTSWLIMDEPTNGLDIPGKSQFRKLLIREMNESCGIVISTHQVQDVEQLLDHVVILDDARVLLDASVTEICHKLYFTQTDNESETSEAYYALPSYNGHSVMLPNPENKDSEINLELLFNGTLAHPETICPLFNAEKSKDMDSQFFNRTERQKALGLTAVVIYAVLTVFSGFYTIRGALRANALSHYVSPQRAEEWKVISADLAQGVDGSWTSVSALFFPILAFYLVGTARRTQRALQATSQAARTLTFPVSAFEQFLLRWLYAVPLALLTYCAVFVAADFTRVGLCSLIVPQVDYAHLLPYADYWNGRVHPYWLLTLLNLMLWAQSVFICTSETKRASVRTVVLLLVILVPFALAHSRYALGEAFNLWLIRPVIVNAFFLLCTVLNWYMAYRHILKTDLTYVKSAKH